MVFYVFMEVILFPQLVENRIKNRIHFRRIMLYHLEKLWITAQPIRYLSEHSGEGTINKRNLRDDSRSPN